MNILKQLGIILFIWLIGEVISKIMAIPIPGSVIGMVVLFICLCSGIIKVEMIEDLSVFILNNLAFFFVPMGVGLLAYLDILKANWLQILLIVIITTILVLVVTGLTVQFLAGKKGE